MGAVESPILSPVSSAVLDFSGSPYTGGSGGGGGGTVAGFPTLVQNSADATPAMGAANFSGAQTFNMPSKFVVGNTVIVQTQHYQAGAVGLTGVTIAGTAATLDHTGVGSAALLQTWRANVVNTARDDVVVTPGAGTGHYLNVQILELSPALTSLDKFAEANATSTAPGAGVNTAVTSQCAQLWLGSYRDDTGTNNTAPTVMPTGWTSGLLQRDGINLLGGASASRIGQRKQAVNATFTCVSTLWYETTITYNWSLPVTIAGQLIQNWSADTTWEAPGTVTVTPLTTELLVFLGGWWNDPTVPGAAPTDNQGAWTTTYNPGVASGSPVVTVAFHQTSPTNVAHTITPPSLTTNGDGHCLVLRIPGVTMGAPIRDQGSVHAYHAPVAPPDPSGYTAATVQTTGTAAKVGDIAIAQFVIDPNSVTNADAAFVVPSGWTVLANQYDMRDNVGYLVLASIVATAGRISASISWTDNATFVYDGSIFIYATS